MANQGELRAALDTAATALKTAQRNFADREREAMDAYTRQEEARKGVAEAEKALKGATDAYVAGMTVSEHV